MEWSEVEQRRIELTTSCRVTDAVPKVAGAGSVADGVQVMHNGVRIVEGCYYGDWMTEVIRRLEGHHEPQEEVVFHAVLERLAATAPERPVALELGAFWAYYSLWFLQRLPEGRAFLVEPDPAYLEVGRRNVELNGRSATFHQAAVGGEVGEMDFPCESDGEVRRIPTETLPSLFERFGLDRVDVVLCDVQGVEHDFLSSGAELIRAGRVRFVIVSTHHHAISDDPLLHQRTLELIRSLGGHVIAEHTVGESFSGDGLVAASFDDRDRDLVVDVPHARVGDSLFGDPLHELAPVAAERDALAAERDRWRAEAERWRAEAEEAERARQLVVGSRTWRTRDRLVELAQRAGVRRG